MKLLAIDTSGESCSVAVVENERLHIELTDASGKTHSKHLMGLVDSALNASRLSFSDLDGIAVTSGPGSFTGLRIGISTVKGIAVAAGKPLVGISALDALAWQGGMSRYLICPLVDARRRELYYSRYRWSDDRLEKETDEKTGSLEEALNDIHEPCVVLGTGVARYREEIQSLLGDKVRFAPSFTFFIRASVIAYLAVERMKRGNIDNPSAFTPTYLRKSDAQIHLEKR